LGRHEAAPRSHRHESSPRVVTPLASCGSPCSCGYPGGSLSSGGSSLPRMPVFVPSSMLAPSKRRNAVEAGRQLEPAACASIRTALEVAIGQVADLSSPCEERRKCPVVAALERTTYSAVLIDSQLPHLDGLQGT